MKKIFAFVLSFAASLAVAQQPQTQTAPIYPVNAKYANGVAPGYAPTAGSGLTLNLSGGTANCAGTIVDYSAGTLTMAPSTTNYVYLNTAASCVPAVKTTAFTSSDIPIAVVVAGSSAITSIADDRTMFQQPGSGGGGGGGNSVCPTASSRGFLLNGTDESSALISQISSAQAAGTAYCLAIDAGKKLTLGNAVTSTFTVPNSGTGTPYTQIPVTIIGAGASVNGTWGAIPPGSSAINMTNNASPAKFISIGAGQISFINLVVEDTSTDCAPFFLFTNTTPYFKNVTFSGTASGTSACNIGALNGGTTTTVGNTTTSAFQGYHGEFDHVYFDKMSTGILNRTYAQAIRVTNSTFSKTSGGTAGTCAIQTLPGSGTSDGNSFQFNLFEMSNYTYGYCLASNGNLIFGDTFWDGTATTVSLFHITGGASENIAYVSKDASIAETQLSDDNSPSGTNAIMDQLWQTGLGIAAVQNRRCNFASGTGAAQVCNTGTPFTPVATSIVLLSTATPNTGAFTLNVNGLGAKIVAKLCGGTVTALAAGDIVSGFNPMWDDGTNWILYTPAIGCASSSGLSGMTAGQVPIAASPSTVTSSKPLAGTGAAVTTGPSTSTINDCALFTTTTGQIGDLPCPSGAVSSLTTTGSSGPASLAGGVLNIPVYTGGGSSGMPFTVVQESLGNSGSGTSFTLTYPQAAAASGNTEFLIVGTGGTTITTPTGWTLDVDYNPAYHTAIFHRTSASDTSVTIALGASTQIGVYYVELSGTRSLDVSTNFQTTPVSNGLGSASIPSTGSITPTAGAWVLMASTTATTGSAIAANPVFQPTNSLWSTRANLTGTLNFKELVVTTGNFTATHTATSAPSPQLVLNAVDTANGAANILFSIK